MHDLRTSLLVVIGLAILQVAIPSGESNSSAQNRSKSAPTPAPTPAASRRRIIEGYSAEFYAGRRIETTCDTANGCIELKIACNKLVNHAFISGPGGAGACVKQVNNSGRDARLGNDSGAQPPPGRDVKYYTITLTNARAVEAHVPDASSFLADPMGTLRRNGFAVPPAAERHWRSLTVALRRLSNPKPPSSPPAPRIHKALARNEVIKNEVVRLRLPRGWIPAVGDLHGDGATSVGEFLSDPVGSLRAQGVSVPVAEEPAWRQLADALKALRRTYASSDTPAEPARDRFYRTKPHVNVSAGAEGTGEQAVTRRITGGAIDPDNGSEPTDKKANAGQPDLMIKQFLFPPTNEKALRVQVVNHGRAASGACRLILTVRKINGTPAGRQTHVNIPALAPGKAVWLVVDAKSILPVSISLEATTFRLNADATELVAESDETNNEVWHNL